MVLALVVVHHAAEGQTLRPLICGRALKLSPLAVLIAILLGVEVGGILGALAPSRSRPRSRWWWPSSCSAARAKSVMQ